MATPQNTDVRFIVSSRLEMCTPSLQRKFLDLQACRKLNLTAPAQSTL